MILSLPSSTYQHCRQILMRCQEFQGVRNLRTVFVTEELARFRNSIPEADNTAQLVDSCIAFLVQNRLPDGKSALLVFLMTIQDRYPQEDMLWVELGELIKEIQELEAFSEKNLSNIESSGLTLSLLQSIREMKVDAAALQKSVIADKPIQDIKQDKLGFDVYAMALRDFISSQSTTTPLTISIEGSWGSGKTSLMRLLQSELNPPEDLMSRIRFGWISLKWFMRYVAAFPVLAFGHMLLGLNKMFSIKKPGWSTPLRKILPANLKTNFMKVWRNAISSQAKLVPYKHPTVWFNAWKFDKEEQLWAALGLEVIDQIKQKYNPPQRIAFWFRLTFKRFSFITALWVLIQKIALPVGIGLVAWQYSAFMNQLQNPLSPNFLFVSVGSPLLWIGALLTGLFQVSQIVKDPFQISVKDLMNNPNYQEKIGFISQFEEDFSNIVSLVTKSKVYETKKLVVFIDDLDRCQGVKAADIIEAINLFLDSEGCIFILGMDSNVVATSIETKYKDMADKITREQPTGAAPGRLFLEKMIQVPFNLPRPTEGNIIGLVNSIVNSGNNAPKFSSMNTEVTKEPSVLPQSEHNLPKVEKATYADSDVSNAILTGVLLLEENPRQLKRFINVFRLNVYIADYRGLFEEYVFSDGQSGLDLNLLAVWVAWSIRWSKIAKCLLQEAQLSTLRGFLFDCCKHLQDNGLWSEEDNSQEMVLNEIFRQRKIEQGVSSSWYHLPWEQWLLEKDFRLLLKQMKNVWQRPQRGQIDYLETLVTMAKLNIDK